ncbi:hypothetical protein BASA81_004785 [Batrachochytrium salamandrivorans]|nr:hypothetical protein BASA81_004785 [Batrachochytrium salamandrivorans]
MTLAHAKQQKTGHNFHVNALPSPARPPAPNSPAPSRPMRVTVLFALLAAYVAQAKLTNCHQTRQDVLGVESVSSSEYGVVTIQGVAGSDLPSTIEAQLELMGVTMETYTVDVCAQVQCPVLAGSKYTLQAKLLPMSGADVKLVSKSACVVTQMPLSPQVDRYRLGGATNQVDRVFTQWRKMYPQAVAKYETFVANWQRIIKHNADPKQTYKMAMNEFGGMTTKEFVQARMGVRRPVQTLRKRNAHVNLQANPMFADPPSELDWTELGKVTEVKNQGSCGSCWAFSATGAIESAFAIKTGDLVSFSDQQMVSCDLVDGACNGGWMDDGFAWAIRGKGLCTTDSYPYTSGTTRARGTCNENECEPVEGSAPTGFEDIEPNETSLLAAVASHGPVSVAIQADEYAFQFYSSGVLVGQCGQNLDHGVLLVGYGVSEGEDGIKYWKLKNSWGANWGEQGFIRIQRDKDGPEGGQCGVAKAASYPIYE